MIAIGALFRRYAVARRLALHFDPAALQRDLARIDESWWRAHLGPYHDGNWESVSLWAPDGDLFNQRTVGGPWAATRALQMCPEFSVAMDAFGCEKNRVRLMRLRSGGHIFRHSDPVQDVAHDLVRLHIPITTNPDVLFLVNEQRLVMQPGEVWHVDVRFPHEVHNRGGEHRVHLVVDLVSNAQLAGWLAAAPAAGEGRLTAYLLKHSLPLRVKRRLGIGN